MVIVSLVPIPLRIAALTQEKNALFEYPVERLAEIVRDVGFQCNCCAKCCTRTFNGHVFLLDREIYLVKNIDPNAIEPAPDPEFCDQNGTFYVSGYALKVQDDESGTCWFLENGRCKIYDRRFVICRIYPYMLHREADENGTIDWRQISGLNVHGEYGAQISTEESLAIARETMEYEHAFLDHEISFLECVQDLFKRHNLRHVQKIYDAKLRQFLKGIPLTVMVYTEGHFEKCEIAKFL